MPWSRCPWRDAPRATLAHVVTATLLPFAANLLYVFGPASLNYVDISPIALTISAAWLMSTLLRRGLMPTLSQTHLSLFDNMRDGVAVLDADHHLIELNPAAEAMLCSTAAALRAKCAGMAATGPRLQACLGLRQVTSREGRTFAVLETPAGPRNLENAHLTHAGSEWPGHRQSGADE